MTVEVGESSDGLLRVAMRGRLDVDGVAAASVVFDRDVVTRRLPTIVDVSDVSFIASLGMGLFVSAAKSLRRFDAKLVLLRPQAIVEAAFRAAGLDGVLLIASDEAGALHMARG